MNREQKVAIVAELKAKFEGTDYFYITDSSSLPVSEITVLRRKCFEKGVELRVAKNTLIKKALEQIDEEKYQDLYESLKGQSTLLFTEVSNLPAKILKEFRSKDTKLEKPVLKVAYIDSSLYVGDDQIETLSKLKSKEELLGEIVGLLQSPAKNVISALQSSGSKLAGILKTLGEREG